MGVTCRDAFLLVGRDLLGGDLRDELLREQRVQVVEVGALEAPDLWQGQFIRTGDSPAIWMHR
jgi:hypothetical protein